MLVCAYSCSSSNVIIYTIWCSPSISHHQNYLWHINSCYHHQNTPVDTKNSFKWNLLFNFSRNYKFRSLWNQDAIIFVLVGGSCLVCIATKNDFGIPIYLCFSLTLSCRKEILAALSDLSLLCVSREQSIIVLAIAIYKPGPWILPSSQGLFRFCKGNYNGGALLFVFHLLLVWIFFNQSILPGNNQNHAHIQNKWHLFSI